MRSMKQKQNKTEKCSLSYAIDGKKGFLRVKDSVLDPQKSRREKKGKEKNTRCGRATIPLFSAVSDIRVRHRQDAELPRAAFHSSYIEGFLLVQFIRVPCAAPAVRIGAKRLNSNLCILSEVFSLHGRTIRVVRLVAGTCFIGERVEVPFNELRLAPQRRHFERIQFKFAAPGS
jgi:hypothetical protein